MDKSLSPFRGAACQLRPHIKSLLSLQNMPSVTKIKPTVRPVARGIFNIVYDSQPPSSRLVSFNRPSQQELLAYRAYAYSMWRFIHEVCHVAPGVFTSYTLCSLYIAAAPAISLSLCYSTLTLIEEAITARDLSQDGLSRLKYLMLIWLVVEVASVLVRLNLDNVALELTGHLKAHFLPRLAKANLSLDVEYFRDMRQAVLHDGWSNYDNVQGLDLVQHLFGRARDILALSLQLFLMLYSVSRSDSHGAQILLYQLLAYFTLSFVRYISGTQGFVFFTDNIDYHHQLSLHTMIYDNPHGDGLMYRETIVKDGIAEYLGDEYCRVSDALGIVTETPWYLATRPHNAKLHWVRVLQNFITDYPLSLCAFMLPLGLSASSLATISFFQYATTVLRETARAVEDAARNGSFTATMREADCLYEVLDNARTAGSKQGWRAYPTKKSSSSGMKLSFRHVSLWYENQISPALHDISVDIEAGQLVLIVGRNGSGKSSLLRLLLRLMEPTSGEIRVDDDSLGNYDIQTLRRAMTFLTQSDTVYPLSVQENLLMGLPYGKVDLHKLERAAEAGGCLDLLRNSGDAIVDPPRIVSQSFDQGAIGPEAHAFLQLHDQQCNTISLSKGQKQRVIAGRMFYRAITTDFRLLVLDEPASSMDASAEHKLNSEFMNIRHNKTTIIVAHHFGTLAKQADLILCMSNGRIVQRGTHDVLIKEEKGEYAQLYDVQASGLE